MATSSTKNMNTENNVKKSTDKATKVLLEVISNHVKNHTNEILQDIAKTYNISYDELKEKYGSKLLVIDVGKNKKTKLTHGPDGLPIEPKKRGRKKKPREELVETEEYEYNGVKYLVDNDNNVYTYNLEQPMLIGTKLIDGRIKYNQQL